VAAILRQLSGEHVPVDAFDSARLPSHLQFKVRAVNASGETVAAGSDLERLQTELRGEQSAAFAALAESEAKWNRDGLKDWTFGDLPEMVELAGRGGSTVAHPMLVDCGDSVSLRLTDDADVADRETRAALSRLFELSQKKRIEQQIAWLPKLETWLAQAASVMAAAEVFSGTATPQSPKALAAEFRRQLSSRIAERSCAGSETPRTEADYRRWLKRAENQISVAAQDVGELLDLLLPKAREVQKLLTGGGQPAIQQAQADVSSQWCELFAGNFLSRHPWDALRHSPRYLEAIVVRWKKLVAGGLARDRELTASVGLFWNKYRQIVRQRPELRSAFETVRWLIEEYRVSLFAQQLRTPVPISDRRLREAWDAAVAKARSA
jgi:ATP-dependent helicase HrpA